MKKIMIIFMLCLMTTSCLGYNDLNNLMIINNFYLSKNNNYTLILNEITEQKEQLDISKKYKKTTISCKTIKTCFNSFKNLPRKVYLSHLDNILLDKNLTADDLVKLIKILNNYKELREDFYIVYLNNKNYKDIINNKSLQTYLKNKSKTITFYDLKKSYITKSKIKIPIIKKTINEVKIIDYKLIDWREYEKN